jgi:uncharacterized protein (TIGR02265 family)
MNSTVSPRLDGSVFEGLFQRALRPTGAFAEALRVVGYNVDNPQRGYHHQVYYDALMVARQHACSSMSDSEAYQKLGRMQLEGFLTTILGRVSVVVAPIIGATALTRRLPRLWRSVDNVIEMKTEELSPTHFHVFFDTYPTPPTLRLAHVICGMSKHCGTMAKINSTVTVVRDEGHIGQIEIRWPPSAQKIPSTL